MSLWTAVTLISIELAVLVLLPKRTLHPSDSFSFNFIVKFFVPRIFDPLKLALIDLLQWLKPVDVLLSLIL